MEYSNETNELLCTMLNENGIDKSHFPHDVLKTLFEDDIVRNSSEYYDNNVYLTSNGKAYLERLHQKEEQIKRQYRHNWKITIFNTLGGAVAGLITSIIFWLITK